MAANGCMWAAEAWGWMWRPRATLGEGIGECLVELGFVFPDGRFLCMLRSNRIFKNTQWIDRMFAAHIHDHILRSPETKRAQTWVISNEYI